MVYLLTSAGITNWTLARVLEECANKSLAEARIAFVPTAANVELGDKSWLFRQVEDLRKFGARYVDVVDISAVGVRWRERLDAVDIIFVSGGNTYHLLDQARKTGFDVYVEQIDDKKVYVGASAGSVVAGQTIQLSDSQNLAKLKDLRGFGVVDGCIKPHCRVGGFAEARIWAEKQRKTVYALDDDSAIAIDNDNIALVGSGRAEMYN